MYQFFIEDSNVSENFVTIEGSDVNHIKNVLRMKQGEELIVCDGVGMEYICEIEAFLEGEIILSILEQKNSSTELPVRLKLYQGLPKSDKLETIIQKCTELGITSVIPVQMARSVAKINEEKGSKKTDRWNKIAAEASKQCGRQKIPEVNNIIF